MKKLRLLSFIAVMLPGGASAERAALPFELVPFNDRALSSHVWDVTGHDVLKDDGNGFIYENTHGFITEFTGNDAEHYILRGDSLIFRGYTRGHNVGALVDSAALVLKFPLEEGDSAVSAYSASGSVDGIPIFRDKGIVCGKVVREGRFIFAPDDTITAILVHELRNCSTSIIDSLTTGNTDDFWRWYLPDSRLPFALQYRRGDDASVRLFMTDRFPGRQPRRSHADTGQDGRQHILDNARVGITGKDASVTLGNLPGTEAEVYIIDTAGNIYGHTVRTLDNSANEFHISLSGIQRQGCMLVITLSGNPPLTGKHLLQ